MSNVNKYTKWNIDTCKEWLVENNPKIECLDDIYINSKNKMNFRCVVDECEWQATWVNISRGTGCPTCAKVKMGNGRRLSVEEAMLKFNNINKGDYDYSLVQYFNNSTKVKIICKKCGDIFLQKPATHWNGSGCPNCNKSKPYDEDSIIAKFKEKHGDTYIYDQLNFKGVKHNIKIGCKIEGHGYFEAKAESHMKGIGRCPICYPFNSIRYKNISIERPDWVKYFKNKIDADNYSIRCSTKLEMMCPECGEPKFTSPSNLFKNGFKCAKCSDGISMPEKFCINLLNSIGVDFIRQKSFEWSDSKRYDFYIPNLDLIIETHGIQHYLFSGRGLKPEVVQANDNIKYGLAVGNGIKQKNYIVVNCMESKLSWFKENFTLSLKAHFNLKDVDWVGIWGNSQKSTVVQAWEIWNGKTEDITSTDLAKKFQVGSTTIVEWLKRGAECGVVEYDPKEEMRKCQKRTIEKSKKKVHQLTLEGNFMCTWDSLLEVKNKLKLHPSYINKCINGKLESYGGFKWACEPKKG